MEWRLCDVMEKITIRDALQMSRTEILSSIRSRLEDTYNQTLNERIQAVIKWPDTRKGQKGLPQRASGPEIERLACFAMQLEAASATLHVIDALEELPLLVADVLHHKHQDLSVYVVTDYSGLDWKSAGIAHKLGTVQGDNQVCITTASAGIAETGTLLVISGETQGTGHSLLPKINFVIVQEADIVANFEDAWEKLEGQNGAISSRAMNFITGPSRTGDVEQRILLGAHGPLALEVVLLKNNSATHS